MQAIKRAIDKKTVDVYTMFNEELNAVKKELTQKISNMPPNHPRFAGQSLWARLLKKRVERLMMVGSFCNICFYIIVSKSCQHAMCIAWLAL